MENEIEDELEQMPVVVAETRHIENVMKTCKHGMPNTATIDLSKNTSNPIAVTKKQDECHDICISSSCVEIAATLLQSMDLKQDPCEDFYSYVCGKWEKNNPIPDDKSSYDTFTKMRDQLDLIIRGLLEKPVIADVDSPATTKAKRLYESCINEEIIERRGAEPLLKFIQDLGGWPVIDSKWNASTFQLEKLVASLRIMHNDILISLWIGPDGKNSSWNVLQIDQADFGMPTREYYLDNNQLYRLAYLGLMTSIAELLGVPRTRAMTDMEEILEFETKLANISTPQEYRRNFTAIYEKTTVADMEKLVPQIKWNRYFELVLNRTVSPKEVLVVYAKDYFIKLGNLLTKTSPRTVANYLIWRIVQNRASNLDERFRSRRRVFSNLLLGNTKEAPRWRTCVQYVNDNLGMAVGAMFVREHFKEDSKEIAQLMIREISISFIELVGQVDWMNDATKRKAKEKMESMIDNIGYPDYVLDDKKLDEEYNGVDFDPDKYFENVVTCLKYLTQKEREELWKPVNRSTWSTTPAVVNAFYSRTKNQIMFPAGILQPPFYNSHFPMTMNFGGIGVVVGHEISHGFDDKGRQFNKLGNLEQWWPGETERHFETKAKCLIEQYNKYQLAEVNLTVNGVQTQGENIADNAGIKLAYRSMSRWLLHNKIPRLPGLHHLSAEQLFFVNFAQVWCGSSRPEAMQFRLRTGVHPPGKFRVIGAVSNMQEFSDAFSCPATSPMNPPKKCQVWHAGMRKHQKGGGKLKGDSSDNVQVFCRVRPLPAAAERCIRRVDDRTIQLTAPSASARNALGKDTQYKFEYAFDEDASQAEVFEDVGLPLVRDLIQGKSGLLFTYGITSSGKTFTMQGRREQPGILPRTLDTLFNTVRPNLAAKYTFKPDRLNGFDIQSQMDSLVDRQRAERDAGKVIRTRGRVKDSENEFSGRLLEDTAVNGLDVDCEYSLFVSYVEIYNNYAYDLLQPDVGEGKMLQSRLLREDNTGHIYVAGATEVEVLTADEALRLLSRGQKARRIASTQLNADSSRSHAIFNIRLVQAPLDETGHSVVQDKDIVQVSLLSLIDLAGSERTKRTNNEGERLREAGNINASLLTLRKCLDALRSNQNGENSVEMVPYRESKLTHLFKSYFEGEGKVRMIVCLNPAAEEYDETTHVLRFAESAQEVHVTRAQQVRFDQLGFTPGRRAAAVESKKRAKENVDLFTDEETIQHHRVKLSFTRTSEMFPPIKLKGHDDEMTLPILARFLEDRIVRHKAMLAALKTQEVEFVGHLQSLSTEKDNYRRENNALRMRLEERELLNFQMEKELDEHIRVRDELLRHSTLSEQAKVDLVGRLHESQYAASQERAKRRKREAKQMERERRSAERRREELEIEKQRIRDNYQHELDSGRERLRQIDGILNGGSEYVGSSARKSPHQIATTVVPSAPFQSSATSTLNEESSQHRAAYAKYRQAGAKTSSPCVNPLLRLTTKKFGTPASNPRYAFGLPHGSGKILEQVSRHRTPMGTALGRRSSAKRKSITRLPTAEELRKCTTYQLELQEPTPDGNVKTLIYKANHAPTCTGGRAVTYCDVETLTQTDP
ncbi:Membrane metallo-endopeptidase-like 1 [Hypsibius exemplaris]|uniref:Membrane metallo-endopeptidase-like 1 n=1 Tax=Hypsibius exemplaris TaxID=2072580 RepID=A0A1W0XDY9_HYPEX|nr:Membrane metallo-endopeptidase-like 1 [Hypsibius exemplaris]